MLDALLTSIVIAQGGPEPGPTQITVGPVHLMERVVDVQKALGTGWSGLDCEDEQNGDGAKCAHVLAYTDGVDQLKLYIDEDFVFLIEARENRAQGGRLRASIPIRRWHWAGGTLFEMPDAVKGWTVQTFRAEPDKPWRKSYGYGHGFGVWFTRNRWSGVDFHMFEE